MELELIPGKYRLWTASHRRNGKMFQKFFDVEPLDSGEMTDYLVDLVITVRYPAWTEAHARERAHDIPPVAGGDAGLGAPHWLRAATDVLDVEIEDVEEQTDHAFTDDD